MPPNSSSQNNNQIGSDPYTSDFDKPRIKKLPLLVVGALFVITVIVITIFLVRPSKPAGQISKYTNSATAAAKKHTPDAKVSNVKVAGGFAIATVRSPSATGQANAGNVTVFKVNKDGSMVQIAEGSHFGPLDLLGFGIPLTTQAELTGTDVAQLEQNLANECGYSNGAIGLSGFSGSFNPGQWQIDVATLDQLSHKLQSAINTQNANASSGNAVICVNATQQNSSVTTDKTTYISTYTLQVQFVTSNGTLTNHTLTFTNGAPRFRTYTLDGQAI